MSELRQDLVSGDWVVIAPGRAARPDALRANKTIRKPTPRSKCPFENVERSENRIIELYPATKKWEIAVIPNKYPIVQHINGCASPFKHEIYSAMTGAGEHELVVTRDHDMPFTALSPALRAKLFEIFQERHRLAADDKCLVYATTFLNYGGSVGSSVWHPHYQFVALPFVPPHAAHSIEGSEEYFRKHHRCVRCDIVKEEKKYKKRVIKENGTAIAFAPYASKRPFEVAVMPKKHESHFGDASPRELADVAELTQFVVRGIKKYAGDPDLNFFIHDAPYDKGSYGHHHWHVEIMPSVSRLGGLEFSTGIYVNMVDPDMAAAILRGTKK
jgi:UDPglucose--hexose-1-phosphate uridylyltransferase